MVKLSCNAALWTVVFLKPERCSAGQRWNGAKYGTHLVQHAVIATNHYFRSKSDTYQVLVEVYNDFCCLLGEYMNTRRSSALPVGLSCRRSPPVEPRALFPVSANYYVIL